MTVAYEDPDHAKQLVVDAVGRALGVGASQAEANLGSGEGLSVTVRDGSTDLLEYQRDKSLAITVYLGQSKGSATTSDLSAAALDETVDAAHRIAKLAEPDPYAGLAEEASLAGEVLDLELDHPWAITGEEAVELATRCENAARDLDGIKQGDGTSVNHYRGTHAYANSNGFAGAYRGTQHSLACLMIAESTNGMQKGYWYTSARKPGDLEVAEEVGRTAAERTIARLDAVKLKTGKLPVLYEAPVARSLVGHLVSAISGGAQYRKASFLLDALGEKVFPASFDLIEQPHLPAALGSAPFDNDGVATRNKTVIDQGMLSTYLLGVYAARRLNRETTGNAGGPRNLIVAPGRYHSQDLIQQLNEGLLVTDLMGFGVNGVTGDYSRGVSGFYIENGEIQYPVEEITIAGNLKEMFLNIEAVSSDIDVRGNVHTGAILIGEMAIAGE